MPACWIEVNLSALRENFAALQTLVGPACRLLPIVKANAYGLGAVQCGRELLDAGAAMLAVTRLDEALPLREAGLRGDVLLLTPALPDEVNAVIQNDFVACLSDFADAERLSQAAARAGKIARAHWKLDTGMGRLGTRAEDAPALWPRIAALPNLQVEACFTHFAHSGDADAAPTQAAFTRFQTALAALNINGPHHCANSSALLRFPAMRLSLSRPGTVLYGQFPSPAAQRAAQAEDVTLRDPFAAKARVVALREVKAGESVGYGGEWTARRASTVATLAIGYADGLTVQPQAREERPWTQLSRALRTFVKPASGRSVTLHGRECPLVGRVAMQQCSVDVTGVAGVQVGDTATVTMRRVTAGAHLPRVYVRD